MPNDALELVRGTLDLLILKAMTWGPKRGLGIVRLIEQPTGDRLQIEAGALYPALRRAEKKGWLTAEWGYTDRNREAKSYRLSPAGRRAVAACCRLLPLRSRLGVATPPSSTSSSLRSSHEASRLVPRFRPPRPRGAPDSRRPQAGGDRAGVDGVNARQPGRSLSEEAGQMMC